MHAQHREIRLAIEDLNAAFAYHLDHNEIDQLVDLFTEDAVYTMGPRRSVGRSIIQQRFEQRIAGGPRTSRHLYSGLRVSVEAEDLARATSVWMSFAQDGEPPLTPAVPFLVADMEDIYVRSQDGKWRFKERHIHKVFSS